MNALTQLIAQKSKIKKRKGFPPPNYSPGHQVASSTINTCI